MESGFAVIRRPSPAKLNLFLHINGRRPDGYHELQTLFVLLDGGDEVEVQARDDDRIVRSTPLPGVAEADDLSVRAALRLRDHARACGVTRPLGAAIEVHKRIPMGGGLGGGSSNAATVLLVLNELWGLDLEQQTLCELGAGLGADVPVFVGGCNAWAEGIGERLVPVGIEPRWYLVVLPPVAVSTAAVFSAPALTRNTPKLKIRDFARAAPAGDSPPSRTPLAMADEPPALDTRSLWAATRNDCEAVVRKTHPEVDLALRALERFAPARMTGTGAAVFAGFDSNDDARAAGRAAGRALGAGWTTWVVRGVGGTDEGAGEGAGRAGPGSS